MNDIAAKLRAIESLVRLAGYPKAEAYMIVRPAAHRSSVQVENARCLGFYGQDALDRAIEWATSLKPSFEAQCAAWFETEPAQASEAA